MSVTRVNEFFAKPAEVENLKKLLMSIRSEVASAEGCREFRVLECEAEPDRFVIVETWDCIESHQAAVERISSPDVERAMAMLQAAPDGHYYVELA